MILLQWERYERTVMKMLMTVTVTVMTWQETIPMVNQIRRAIHLRNQLQKKPRYDDIDDGVIAVVVVAAAADADDDDDANDDGGDRDDADDY